MAWNYSLASQVEWENRLSVQQTQPTPWLLHIGELPKFSNVLELRREDCESETRLGYTEVPCLKRMKHKQTTSMNSLKGGVHNTIISFLLNLRPGTRSPGSLWETLRINPFTMSPLAINGPGLGSLKYAERLELVSDRLLRSLLVRPLSHQPVFSLSPSVLVILNWIIPVIWEGCRL